MEKWKIVKKADSLEVKEGETYSMIVNDEENNEVKFNVKVKGIYQSHVELQGSIYNKIKRTPFEEIINDENYPFEFSSVGLLILKKKINTNRKLKELINTIDIAIARSIKDYLNYNWVPYCFDNIIYNIRRRRIEN